MQVNRKIHNRMRAAGYMIIGTHESHTVDQQGRKEAESPIWYLPHPPVRANRSKKWD